MTPDRQRDKEVGAMRYTEKFKQATVDRFYSSGECERAFSRKYKIDRGTLSNWLKIYSQNQSLGSKDYESIDNSTKLISWSSNKKLWAVYTYKKLEGSEKGKFLRENGLYSHQVNKWEIEMLKGLDIGIKNLSELKFQVKKMKEQEAIIELQKKTSQFFLGEAKS